MRVGLGASFTGEIVESYVTATNIQSLAKGVMISGLPTKPVELSSPLAPFDLNCNVLVLPPLL